MSPLYNPPAAAEGGGGDTPIVAVHKQVIAAEQTSLVDWGADGTDAFPIVSSGAFTLDADAFLEILFRAEVKHDGNGFVMGVFLDDVEIRDLSNLNTQVSSQSNLTGTAYKQVVLGGVSDGDSWIGNADASASKLREFGYPRSLLVAQGAHEVIVRMGGQSGSEVAAKNAILICRTTLI